MILVSPEQRIEQLLDEFQVKLVFCFKFHLEKQQKKEDHLQDYLKTPNEIKKEEIALSYKSNLNLVADAKKNLDNIRKEPLNLAFLLKDVEICRFKVLAGFVFLL